MKFIDIQQKVKEQFDNMSRDANFLYKLNLEKNELWNIYLESFPEGKNEIFRERRIHDCSACRSFINHFGDVVIIKDNKMVSIWDFDISDDEYEKPIKALSNHIKTKMIKDIYINSYANIGIEKNHEDVDGTINTYNHYYVILPNKFLNKSYTSIDTIKSKYRDIKQVFTRSLEEISENAVETVLELISQNSLYRGEEWKNQLNDFLKYQKEYKLLNDFDKNIYVWDKATSIGESIGKIRNHSIGTLLNNITDGMDLDVAVRKYEEIVAPMNYKRPNPIYTKKMLDDAKKKIEELGYMNSLQRRFAILEDISVNNVLFSNKDVSKKLQSNNVFDEMEQEIPENPKKFDKVEEINIDKFIEDVLPNVKNMEVLFENRHSNNMVSLIAPYNNDGKTMFKWDNNFSWAYSGNITDSNIKHNVKNAGGRVDGVLRFSIQWNDENIHNRSDYDAHCIEPCGNEIYYSNKHNRYTTGDLDVDIIDPKLNQPAVENITWSNINKMEKGTYKFFVHNFSHRSGDSGFKAEIEFNGQQYNFEYNRELRQDEKVQVAEVYFDGTNFTIKEKLSSNMSVKEIWNLKSNNFAPVSVMMYSPNYWNGQGTGNKHYFFMLKDCKNDETPNGFFNEYLNNELTPHRKVFEALGSKMKVDYIDNQLSGIGFSSTQRNSVIVKIKGNVERILKIMF